MTAPVAELSTLRQTAPRLLHLLAFAALAAGFAFTGSWTFQVMHLRGAAASTTAWRLLAALGLLLAAVLLSRAGVGMAHANRRRALLIRRQAAEAYSQMMHRTAAIELEIYGDVLSFSVWDWLRTTPTADGQDPHLT